MGYDDPSTPFCAKEAIDIHGDCSGSCGLLAAGWIGDKNILLFGFGVLKETFIIGRGGVVAVIEERDF